MIALSSAAPRADAFHSDSAARLRLPCGSTLNVHAAGDRQAPAVLLCNAVGMPVELLAPLAGELARSYRVLTWDSRLLPSGEQDSVPASVSIEQHAQDAIAVLDSFEVDSAAVVGWCTGARLALRIARSHAARVRCLALLNGGYGFADVAKTPFEATMSDMMPKMARDARTASVLHAAFFGSGAGRGAASLADRATLLSSSDPELIGMTGFPYRTAESLFRYARLITGFVREPLDAEELDTPLTALVATTELDTTTSPVASKKLAELLPNASFVSLPGADHLAIFSSEAFRSEVRAFLHGCLLQG